LESEDETPHLKILSLVGHLICKTAVLVVKIYFSKTFNQSIYVYICKEKTCFLRICGSFLSAQIANLQIVTFAEGSQI
jgi:hypothetical protein